MHFKRTFLLFFSLAGLADCTLSDNDKVLSELKLLGTEATAFCSSFLGIPKRTITASTVTPIVTVTTTNIVLTTVRVDKRNAPTPAADCVFGRPCPRVQRRDHPVPSQLRPYAQGLISLGCSLLRITPAVTTVTATLPPKTTTVTTTSTAIITVKRLNCDADATHNISGNGSGNTVVFSSQSSALSCCQVCQTTLNCVANAFVSGTCQFLVKTVVAPGQPTSAMCPLGVAGYPFGPDDPSGIVFKGPCGP